MAITLNGTTGIDAGASLEADDVVVTGTITATTFGTSSQNAYGTRTISTSDPTGGSDGDIWYKY